MNCGKTFEVFFLVLLSQERKKYTTSPNHNTALLGYGQLGPSFCSSGSVLLLLLYRSSTPSLLQLTVPSPPWRRPSPLADLPPADPPWASRCPPHQSASGLVGQVAYALGRPRCPPNQSASRLVEQVADAVEFWLCFPVFWHQSHSCVCSLLVIVSTLRSDNLFGL